MINEQTMKMVAINGAMHLRNATPEQVAEGNVMDAFTLSYAMEILTGTPKEACLTLLLDGQEKLKKFEEEIVNKA